MIKYVLHKDLDIVKYDNCIQNSLNSRIYAFSWYLDIVTDNWDALVYNEYEAVMPLPIRKKYGINYIYVPPWVQQLGLFSKYEIDKQLIHDFLNSIPRKYKLVDINFNSKNSFQHKKVLLKDNYILNLEKSYEDLRMNFSKSRKWRINQAQKLDLKIVEEDNIDTLIEVFKNNKEKEIGKSIFDFSTLKTLVKKLQSIDKVKVQYIKSKKNELFGGAIFISDKNRITYLFSAINNEGKKNQAMSFLIDHMIQINANSKLIFDFEGSMIKEIANYFKSFGAIKEIYYHFNQKKIL